MIPSYPTNQFLLKGTLFPLINGRMIHTSKPYLLYHFETPYDKIIPLKNLPYLFWIAECVDYFNVLFTLLLLSQFLVHIPDSI